MHAALNLDLSASDRQDGLVLCGTALQQWAQQVLETAAQLPDPTSAQQEKDADLTASQLLDRAVQVCCPAIACGLLCVCLMYVQ